MTSSDRDHSVGRNCYAYFGILFSFNIGFILHLGVFIEKISDVIELLLSHMSPTDRTPLVLIGFVLDFTSKYVRFLESLHIPVSIQTYQMESMETLINSHEVYSICELLCGKILIILAEILKTYSASTVNSIIKFSQYFSEFLMQVVDISCIICVLFFHISQCLQSIGNINYINIEISKEYNDVKDILIRISKAYILLCEYMYNFVYLFIIKTFDRCELKRRRIKWVLYIHILIIIE